MQQLTQTSENTPAKWAGVIADLSAKRQAAHEHLEQLRSQKRELALEAGMGGGDAKKRLEKTNAELTRVAFEIDDWDVAITQAETKKRQAEKAEADVAEQARHAELSVLASTALLHAAEFTDSLRQAARAGAALKLVVQNMQARATLEERPHLDRLLQPGPFMRAAELAGLRAHLEFAPYTGPQVHVVALEDALAVHLERWLLQVGERSEP